MCTAGLRLATVTAEALLGFLVCEFSNSAMINRGWIYKCFLSPFYKLSIFLAKLAIFDQKFVGSRTHCSNYGFLETQGTHTNGATVSTVLKTTEIFAM